MIAPVPLRASIEIVHFDKDGNVISVEKEEVPIRQDKED